MTDQLALLAFEIEQAKQARQSQKFNLNSSSLDKARQGLNNSTFFDIETAGLDPKGQVYESGFLSTSPTGEETYRQSFYKTDVENLSGFSQRTIGKRAVPEGVKLGEVLSGSTVGQERFADHFKAFTPGTDVWVHNLNFESRFLAERMPKDDFLAWARGNNLESFSDYSPRLFETNMGVKRAIGAAQGLSYSSRGTLDDYLGALEDTFSEYRSAFIDNPRPAGVTRVGDSMTLARSVFGLAQKHGAMAKTGEVFAGTSIETMAKAAFGLTERHTALGDAALQKGVTEFLFATGMDIQDKRELTDQQKNFFKIIEGEQQTIKQQGAVRTIIDAFNNQQRYALEGDPELLKGVRTDVGSRQTSLGVSAFDPATGNYVDERVVTTMRSPFKLENTTTDIDEFVAARKEAGASQYGLKPDWDRALGDAKSGYINEFNETYRDNLRHTTLPAGHQGPTMPPEEALRRTLTSLEPKADLAKRLTPPDPSLLNKTGKFLGDNWKVGLGLGIGIALLSHFSGKDDDYNYLEGLKHQGFAGETRRYNTDFGSGWQGLQEYDLNNLFGFMNQNNHKLDPNDGLSKRENDDRQIAKIGIRSYAVEDADTVRLMLSGGGEMTLRLAGIDAPETTHENQAYNPLQDQPYGEKATGRLEDLLSAQGDMSVMFSPTGSDTYGRTAGLIIAEDGTNINLELVRAGAAAALPYGPSDERLYSTGAFAKAQNEAIQSGEGMWAQDEWLAAQNAMSNRQRLTHATLADPQDIYQNFRAAAVLHRMKNPDADLSEMMAAGGKDDFNINEGLKHGWANANRRADIGDFGSGYVIDKLVRRPAKSILTKSKLMKAHSDARSYVKSMFDHDTYVGHHRG